VTVGFASFAILAALAATSNAPMMRRLGKWWARLHSLVYAAAALAVVHYFWLVKADRRAPLRYAALVGVLLAFRAAGRLRELAVRRESPSRAGP
jgi:sulfoxide reductase heme-binding subunit YedZ